MPLDVSETPETNDQGIGEWIGASRKEVGEGHPGLDFGLVEFDLQDIIDPATGAAYANYPTGGLDITALVSDTRHCRFKRILHMEVTPWDSDNVWTGHIPAISVPNGQFKIHRPVTGDVLLKLFVQTGTLDEPMKEMDDQTAIPNMTVRVKVTGVRGNNFIDLSPPV
jgi:hypothetical protein